MSKDSRMGGKFSGSHTTCIPLAAQVADVAVACSFVSKVTLGYIKAGIGTTLHRKVKFTDDEGSILLAIRDNTSHQEIRVYVSDVQRAREALARNLRNLGIRICFK